MKNEIVLRPSHWACVSGGKDSLYMLNLILHNLDKYYPSNYNELMKLAKDTELLREKELGRPFSVFDGNPKYNSDYKNKRVREVYLPKLEEQIRKEVKNGYR